MMLQPCFPDFPFPLLPPLFDGLYTPLLGDTNFKSSFRTNSSISSSNKTSDFNLEALFDIFSFIEGLLLSGFGDSALKTSSSYVVLFGAHDLALLIVLLMEDEATEERDLFLRRAAAARRPPPEARAQT